jgi:hypothetical protein
MQFIAATIYALCVLTSMGAMWLLLRSYRQNGSRLLLWSAAAFIAFAINNLLLFADFVTPSTWDFRPERVLSALAGVAILLYGFIWELD